MARSGSENPGDSVNLDRLAAELRGTLAEAQRLLAEATQAQKQSGLEATRADRQKAASETRARRARVGTGGTPAEAAAEPAVIEEQVAANRRALTVEEQRVAAVRERFRLEKEAARQARLPVPYQGGGGFVLGSQQSAADKIEAQGRYTAQRLAEAQRQAEQRAAYDQRIGAQEASRTAASARYAVDQAARGGGQLLLGPGSAATAKGPTIPPAKAVPLSAAANVEELSKADQALADRARAAVYSEDQLSQSIAYNSRVIGLSSNAYQKHGYLTSEFIQAAGKGQVTFRELGQQVGGTIAKFAGWTAAATAVYGALGAVQALGKGALESSNGVQLLNRVIDQTKRGGINNDALQGRVSDLSRQFNVPIDDANQAVYGSLKAFHGDLPQALAASKEALFGVKVGELSAADSTKYLTSIVQGFQLTAKDLPGVFDTINQAQNRFGGSSAAMTAGVAKAAGAFKLAGGSYRELIALLQTGSRLTGRTPDAVATAVQRSAGRVLTAPGITALKAAGLDPNQDYPKLLAQAAQLAKGASKQRVEELARALVPQGGTYAAIFAPLLQDIARGQSGTFAQVTKAITAQQSKGSADKELARVLKEPGERLKQVTGDAERLGVTLARLGAGALPGALLGSLDLVLHTVDDILKVVNAVASIAGPFKPLTIGALEFAAALKLIRRFDVGSSLPVGKDGSAYSGFRGSLQRNPIDRERSQVLQGLDDQRKFVEAERARAAVGAGTTGTQLALAQRNVDTLKRGGASGQELADAQRRVEALEARHLEQIQLQELYLEEQLRTQGQINVISNQKFKTLEALRAELVAQNVYFTNPTLNRPEGALPVPVGGRGVEARTAARAGAGAAEAAGPAAAAVLAARQAREAEAASQASQRFTRLESSLGGLSSKVAESGPILRGGAAAFTTVGGAVLTAGRAAEAAAVGFKASAARMLDGFGALEKGGAVLAALYVDYKLISNAVSTANRDQVTRAIDRGDLQGAKAQQNGFTGNLPIVGRHGFFGSPRGLIGNAADAFADVNPFGSSTPDQQARDEARHAAEANAALARAQSKGTLLYQGDIQANLKKDLARAGNDTKAQQEAINKALEAEAHSFANNQGNARAREIAAGITRDIKAQLGVIQAVRGQLALAVQAVTDSKGLQDFNKGVIARGDIGDTSPTRTARGLGYSTARARELLGTGQITSADAGARIAESDQGAQKALEDELNRKLAAAKGNVGEQNAARSSFIARLRVTRLGPLRAEISRLEADTKEFPDHARSNAQAIKELRKGLDYESQQIESTVQEQRNAQFDASQKLYDARTAQQATAANDPVASLRIHLQRDRARLAAVAERYGKNSAEYIAALTNAESEHQQLVSAIIDRYSSEQDLQEAKSTVGATDEVKQQAAVDKAKAVLAFAKSHGGSDDQIRQAAIAVYQAEDAMSSAIKQRSDDLAEAQRALALSTLDPSDKVGAAKVNLRYDRLALGRANTEAERIKAQAAINTDLQTQRDSRLGAKADLIDYQLGMEQIDKSTAAAEYEALARRVKNNKDLYRQYKLKAHELEKDASSPNGGGYELDVSNIKLPTPYEVNRAIKEGRRAVSEHRQNNTINNRTTINVDIKNKDDVAAFGDVLERHLGGGTRSALRAQGVIG